MIRLILTTAFIAAVVYFAFMRRGGKMLGMFYVPSRGMHADTYTYDGRPLKGKKVGTPFEMVVVPGTSTMTSVYTGTAWTDIGCLSYAGKKVGFVGTPYYKRALANLADKHKQVRVWATITGYDAGGWPIVQLGMPKDEWFKDALES